MKKKINSNIYKLTLSRTKLYWGVELWAAPATSEKILLQLVVKANRVANEFLSSEPSMSFDLSSVFRDF